MPTDGLRFVDPGQMDAIGRRLPRAMAEALADDRHLWVVFMTFGITDEVLARISTHPPHFDPETLMGRPAIACYICEQGFRPALLGQPCPGEPRE